MGNDKRILVYQQGLSNGVSGSCYIVRITFTESQKELIYLVDCGMFLGDSTGEDGTSEKEESALFNLNFPIDDMSMIEGIFVTHGHIDHIGRLPFLTKYGYSNPIYISKGTDAFLYQALSDTQRVLNKKTNFPEGGKFLQSDVEKVMSLRTVINFEYEGDYKSTKIYQRHKLMKELGQKVPRIAYRSPNVRQVYFDGKNEVLVHFFSNAHLIGAACILLEINVYDNKKIVDNVNLFYTGDYKKNNPFFYAPVIPRKYRKRPITIVTESTYGKSIKTETEIYQKDPGVTEHVNEETGEIFKENVIRCIAGGGSMLIPVIALERTETVMSQIRELQDEGIPIFFNPEESQNAALFDVVKKSKEREPGKKINDNPVFFDVHKNTFKLSSNVPIFLVGNLATSYLQVFLNRDDIGLNKNKIEKIKPQNFATYAIGGKDPMDIIKIPGQKIILATPGMMTGGYSLKLGLNLIQDKKNWIHFTSYVATGIAQELINAKRGEILTLKNGMVIPINGVVVQTTEFSGHARPDELMSFINKFSNIKSVIVTHGSPSAKIKFAQYIREQRPDIKNIVISSRKVNFRISYEGVDKVISTSSSLGDIHPKKKENFKVSKMDYSKIYEETAYDKKGKKNRKKKYGYNRRKIF